MYGCELWNLSYDPVENFKIAWRKVKRRIWNIPPQSHNTIVHNLGSDIDILLDKRMLKFIHNALNRNKICIDILTVKLRSVKSCFADNYRYLSCKYNLSSSDWANHLQFLLGKVKMKMNLVYPTSNEASTIKELCYMRENKLYDVVSYKRTMTKVL